MKKLKRLKNEIGLSRHERQCEGAELAITIHGHAAANPLQPSEETVKPLVQLLGPSFFRGSLHYLGKSSARNIFGKRTQTDDIVRLLPRCTVQGSIEFTFHMARRVNLS